MRTRSTALLAGVFSLASAHGCVASIVVSIDYRSSASLVFGARAETLYVICMSLGNTAVSGVERNTKRRCRIRNKKANLGRRSVWECYDPQDTKRDVMKLRGVVGVRGGGWSCGWWRGERRGNERSSKRRGSKNSQPSGQGSKVRESESSRTPNLKVRVLTFRARLTLNADGRIL